jgi:hypothetical protein
MFSTQKKLFSTIIQKEKKEEPGSTSTFAKPTGKTKTNNFDHR